MMKGLMDYGYIQNSCDFFFPESTKVTYCIVGDLTEQFELEV